MFSTWYGLWRFKDLARRTASDKILRDKSFNIAKNRKYDGYQRGIVSMVYKFFDKKSLGSGVNMHAKNERPLDLATQKLVEYYTKQLLENLKEEQCIPDLNTIFEVLI